MAALTEIEITLADLAAKGVVFDDPPRTMEELWLAEIYGDHLSRIIDGDIVAQLKQESADATEDE